MQLDVQSDRVGGVPVLGSLQYKGDLGGEVLFLVALLPLLLLSQWAQGLQNWAGRAWVSGKSSWCPWWVAGRQSLLLDLVWVT